MGLNNKIDKIIIILLFINLSLFAQPDSEFESTSFNKEATAMLIQAIVGNSFVDNISLNRIEVIKVDKDTLLNKYLELSNYNNNQIEDNYKKTIIKLLNSDDNDQHYYDDKNDIVNIFIVNDFLRVKLPSLRKSMFILDTIFSLNPYVSKEDFLNKSIVHLFDDNFNNEYDLFRYCSKVLYTKLKEENFILNIYPLVYIKVKSL